MTAAAMGFLPLVINLICGLIYVSAAIGHLFLWLLYCMYNGLAVIAAALCVLAQEFQQFAYELDISIACWTDQTVGKINSGIEHGLKLMDYMYALLEIIKKGCMSPKFFGGLLVQLIYKSLELVGRALLLIGDAVWYLLSFVPLLAYKALSELGNWLEQSLIVLHVGLKQLLANVWSNKCSYILAVSTIYFLSANYLNLGRFALNCVLKTLLLICKTLRRVLCVAFALFKHLQGLIYKRAPQQAICQAKTQNTSPTLAEEQRCIICYDHPKSTVVFPCRHMCLCEYCSADAFSRLQGKCPLCRNKIDRLVKVYV